MRRRPVILPTGFRVQPELWPPQVRVLLELGEPWPIESCILDLRWWTLTRRLVPPVAFLRRRWRWSRRKVEGLLASTTWYDRTLPRPTRATGRFDDEPATPNEQRPDGAKPTTRAKRTSQGGR